MCAGLRLVHRYFFAYRYRTIGILEINKMCAMTTRNRLRLQQFEKCEINAVNVSSVLLSDRHGQQCLFLLLFHLESQCMIRIKYIIDHRSLGVKTGICDIYAHVSHNGEMVWRV